MIPLVAPRRLIIERWLVDGDLSVAGGREAPTFGVATRELFAAELFVATHQEQENS